MVAIPIAKQAFAYFSSNNALYIHVYILCIRNASIVMVIFFFFFYMPEGNN